MALGAVRLCVLLTVAQGAAAKTVEDLRADLKTRGQRLKEATFRQGGVDSLSQSQSQLKGTAVLPDVIGYHSFCRNFSIAVGPLTNFLGKPVWLVSLH